VIKLRLDFIKCIIQKSRTLKHFLTFLPDAYLATKILDMSWKNLTYGNPNLHATVVLIYGQHCKSALFLWIKLFLP